MKIKPHGKCSITRNYPPPPFMENWTPRYLLMHYNKLENICQFVNLIYERCRFFQDKGWIVHASVQMFKIFYNMFNPSQVLINYVNALLLYNKSGVTMNLKTWGLCGGSVFYSQGFNFPLLSKINFNTFLRYFIPTKHLLMDYNKIK